MIKFPPCKINIGLQILRKRQDGYHDIATVFYPLPLTDVLEVISAKETSLHITGNPVPGEEKDNLCLKAYHLLKKDFHRLPAVSIYLHKVIPTGAGLGGGSSDAAYMLRILNKKYNLQIPPARLLHYADQLGSDCAFFLQDKPCYATGRGNELFPLTKEDLSGYHFVLVCPDIHINTAWAYGKVIPHIPHRSVLDLVRERIETWEETIVNDFEHPVFETYPSLKKIKETLYKQGALYASLSGSGAAVYGIFPEKGIKQKALSFESARTFYF
jgi:4-diphosphocytidyl-2-C-methyl-D-erythritol kinase